MAVTGTNVGTVAPSGPPDAFGEVSSILGANAYFITVCVHRGQTEPQ